MPHLLLLFALISALQATAGTCDLRLDTSIPMSHGQGSTFEKLVKQTFDDHPTFHLISQESLPDSIARLQSEPALRNASKESLINARYPAQCVVKVNLANPQWSNYRRPFLFFMCEHKLQISAEIDLTSANDSIQPFRVTLQADTLLSAGYCGLFDKVVAPISGAQQIQLEKLLYLNLNTQLQRKLSIVYPHKK